MLHRPPGRIVWLLLALLAAAPGCRPSEQTAPPIESAEPLPAVTTKSGAEMVLLPGGTYLMGSTSGKSDEAPVHEVRIDAFLIDRTEVTQEHYAKLVVPDPSHFKGPKRPVEQVSWADAAMYCNLRSKDEGLRPCYDEDTAKCDFSADGYRLPTEAEWEYACRAGSTADYSFGSAARQLPEHAWCAENSGKKTQPVAQKKPNAWGLYDMHGNVAEWCNDVYEAGYYAASPRENPHGPADGEKYVLRGGAWNSSAEACRSTVRVGEDPGFQDACFARDAIGFRCVRRAPAASQKETGRWSPGFSLPASSQPEGCTPMSGRIIVPLAMTALSVADQPRPGGKTGLVYDEIYLRHQTGNGHPERSERLEAIVQGLKKTGFLPCLVPLQPQPAEEKWLLAIHSPEHLAHLKRACEGEGRAGTSDTPVSKESYAAALMAAGGVMKAIDAVVEGKVENAFCAIRPPGHHATRDRAMGFCLLNNIAIAARYAQQHHHLGRVLIVDWDVHHGNGTQAAFDDDPTVLYFSVHQDHFYPGTGSADDRGRGKAAGTKINVPLPAGSGDREYRKAFEEKLVPAAAAFRPDLVLISAGFDAHEHDRLGGMQVTTECFADLTRIVRRIARQSCNGRLVSVLEGGYTLDKLAESVEAHVKALMERREE